MPAALRCLRWQRHRTFSPIFGLFMRFSPGSGFTIVSRSAGRKVSPPHRRIAAKVPHLQAFHRLGHWLEK
jgi:hypothetical protein